VRLCRMAQTICVIGSPLRLRTATKLGFKNPKWMTAIKVTNTYPGGYWESMGQNWFSGM
jgi:DMSO/TMAO reductase YedYZ molybdopterin-dependent catalytic subunit